MNSLPDDILFEQAIEIPDAIDQQHFIRAMAADEGQVSRVSELVEAHGELESSSQAKFFDLGAGALGELRSWGNADDEKFDLADSTVGGYQLLELLGEGGMGLVYSAQQTYPIRRCVALKLIKPGMDSRKFLQRFELEKHILQQMKHPGITRILDAGLQPNGRPFFAMELVQDAKSIVEHADDAKLDIGQRIELFREVCDAVQHAHHRGVIHRDLKPTNVLVSVVDGKPCIKVIDFGIAKATHDVAESPTQLTTGLHECMGTLAYMSPEQSPWNDDEVDTRSDVYSLGRILSELLCGVQPIRQDPSQETSVATLVTQLATLSEAELAQVVSNRSTSASSLRHDLGNELDWICAKACAPSVGDRYRSANDLSIDLKNFLSNRVVSAARPSRIYHARKFVLRNRLLTSIIAIASLATLTTAGVASYYAYKASQAERNANELLKVSLAVQAELGVQKARAEKEKRTALAFVHHKAVNRASKDAAMKYYDVLMRVVRSGDGSAMAKIKPNEVLNFSFLTEPHHALPIRGDFSWLEKNIILDHAFEVAMGFSSDEISSLTELAKTHVGLAESDALVEGESTRPYKLDTNSLRLYFQRLMLREMCKQLPKEDPMIAEIIDNCAAICLEIGEYEQAEKYLRESVNIWKSKEFHVGRAIQSQLFLARSLVLQGKHEEFQRVENDASELLKVSELTDSEREALQLLLHSIGQQ